MTSERASELRRRERTFTAAVASALAEEEEEEAEAAEIIVSEVRSNTATICGTGRMGAS